MEGKLAEGTADQLMNSWCKLHDGTLWNNGRIPNLQKDIFIFICTNNHWEEWFKGPEFYVGSDLACGGWGVSQLTFKYYLNLANDWLIEWLISWLIGWLMIFENRFKLSEPPCCSNFNYIFIFIFIFIFKWFDLIISWLIDLSTWEPVPKNI